MRSCRITFIVLCFAIACATGCYEPVDLRSAEDFNVPWVHCILSPADTQWLELRYITGGGSDGGSGINEATVSLYEYVFVDGGNDRKLTFLGRFGNVGDGLWMFDTALLGSGHVYRLTIEGPGLDSIWAETTMPSFNYPEGLGWNYSKGLGMRYTNYSDVEFIKDRDDDYFYEYEIDGRKFRGLSEGYRVDNTIIPCRHDRPRYKPGPYAVGFSMWCYKVGWSEERQCWFIEDYLATNLDDRADGFNSTGEPFTGSATPEALALFPEVAGKPLHYRYLRFPDGSISAGDTIAISGDFSGPHYGDARPVTAISEQMTLKTFYNAMGLPYDNIFTTGHAGYVDFKMVSDEYDLYLKDVAQMELLREVGSDIIGIYADTNHYSNIHGGTGIFGAEVDNKLYWSCGVWRY